MDFEIDHSVLPAVTTNSCPYSLAYQVGFDYVLFCSCRDEKWIHAMAQTMEDASRVICYRNHHTASGRQILGVYSFGKRVA